MNYIYLYIHTYNKNPKIIYLYNKILNYIFIYTYI